MISVKDTVAPTAPWGDIPPSTTEPVHLAIIPGEIGCGPATDGALITKDGQKVTCANCLAAMPINGRLSHDQLRAADKELEDGAFSAGLLAGEFAKLLGTHELTAAHHAIFARLDSGEFSPAQVQWIATVLIGREALRREAGGRTVPWPVFGEDSPAEPNDAALWESTIAARRHGDVPAGAPTPRTRDQIAAIHGRNAIEVYDEPTTDAQQILAQISERTEGEATA